MQDVLQEKLAASLTATTTDLIPFLPYLLQDLWELGADPEVCLSLLRRHGAEGEAIRLLDLGCGKGAVSIRLCKAFQCRAKGIDLLPAFVAAAQEKAVEWGVSELCEFVEGDANAALQTERGYDLVVVGAIGDVLGPPRETLRKVRGALRPGGYVLMDEAYLREAPPDARGACGIDGMRGVCGPCAACEACEARSASCDTSCGTCGIRAARYRGELYMTRAQWLSLFESEGFALIDEVPADQQAGLEKNECDLAFIAARAGALKKQHPEKSDLFDSYILSQQDEVDDLTDAIVGVTWLLRAATGSGLP